MNSISKNATRIKPRIRRIGRFPSSCVKEGEFDEEDACDDVDKFPFYLVIECSVQVNVFCT